MPSSVSWSSSATLRPTYERILPQWMRQREHTATSSVWDRTHQQVLNGQNTNRTAAAAAFNPVTTSAYWPDLPELFQSRATSTVWDGQNTYRTAAATAAAFNSLTTSAYWPGLPELFQSRATSTVWDSNTASAKWSKHIQDCSSF